MQCLLEGVKRAGPDIAVNDAEGANDRGRQFLGGVQVGKAFDSF
jgi:hypothetical protein